MKNSPHLKFYTDHKISPVRQKIATINQLLEYRASLYRGIGIIPLTIGGSDVLEVAPGSGQNGLFIASCIPNQYTLVEPNPTAIGHIKDVYKEFRHKHTRPKLIPQMLEDYNSKKQFDIVVCENWLGRKKYERRLFKKLLSLTKPSGIVITTVISPIGILPNMIRRAMSVRLIKNVDTFEEKEKVLITAFSSHLRTIDAMTRPAIDWIQDNMINPGYLDICVTIPDIFKDVGRDFDILGSYPRFSQDWRWFKSVYGRDTKFNKSFEDEYYKWCHGFLSYEMVVKEGSVKKNQSLESYCIRFINQVKELDSPNITDQNEKKLIKEMISTLRMICKIAKGIYPSEIYNQLLEGCLLFANNDLNPKNIKICRKFISLFGRETLYVSLLRK
jgi:hypothetical protein